MVEFWNLYQTSSSIARAMELNTTKQSIVNPDPTPNQRFFNLFNKPHTQPEIFQVIQQVLEIKLLNNDG